MHPIRPPAQAHSRSYIMWRWDWHQRINVRKEPLREEDQIYLACKALGKSPEEWEVIDEHEREEMLERKIWIPAMMKRQPPTTPPSIHLNHTNP